MNTPLQRVRSCNEGVPVDGKADGNAARRRRSARKLKSRFVGGLQCIPSALESEYIVRFRTLCQKLVEL